MARFGGLLRPFLRVRGYLPIPCLHEGGRKALHDASDESPPLYRLATTRTTEFRLSRSALCPRAGSFRGDRKFPSFDLSALYLRRRSGVDEEDHSSWTEKVVPLTWEGSEQRRRLEQKEHAASRLVLSSLLSVYLSLM